jgi:tellurite methyltransferase
MVHRSDREHWNTRYSDSPWPRDPSPWLVDNVAILPDAGRVLDVAGGTGRNAIWLAKRGWDVTIADVSDVALEIAATRAHAEDVTIHVDESDLTRSILPHGPWDLVLVFHYLDRNLFAMFPSVLAPGGVLIGALATVRNLERNARPPLPYLLDEDELPGLVGDLDLVRYVEGWQDGHHDARFIARKPADG